MTTVHDAAAYILDKQGKMSTMKLQKLLYYSQAWHLVWAEEPLFDADFQAWANGPVVCEVYERHRGQFSVDGWPWGNPDDLTGLSKGIVDDVLEDYGPLAGHQLSRLTHGEDPWKEARVGLEATARSNRVIEKDRIQDFYAALWTDEDAEFISDIEWEPF